MASLESVWGTIAVTGIIVVNIAIWNMYRDGQAAGTAISQQLEEKKDSCLFGYQSFCVDGKLYIRNPQNKAFGEVFTLRSDSLLTNDRREIPCAPQ